MYSRENGSAGYQNTHGPLHEKGAAGMELTLPISMLGNRLGKKP